VDKPGWVLVFGKPPVAGRAKTRLGATLGHDAAAEVARALLSDTFQRVRDLGARVALATTDPRADHGVQPDATWDQGGGDLGQRVERMVGRALDDGGWALALGADAPHVPAAALHEAVVAMRDHDAALGPSDDGGFWGLALRRCPAGLLEGLPWSQPHTGRATRERLVARGLSVHDLPPWWDVDDEADLRRLVAHGDAQRTVAVARRWLA